MLKIYQCGDEDLYAAVNLEQARKLAEEMTGELLPDEFVREWSDQEIDAPQPEFDENENPTGGMTSVRRMLAEHGDEPGWLAGPM